MAFLSVGTILPTPKARVSPPKPGLVEKGDMGMESVSEETSASGYGKHELIQNPTNGEWSVIQLSEDEVLNPLQECELEMMRIKQNFQKCQTQMAENPILAQEMQQQVMEMNARYQKLEQQALELRVHQGDFAPLESVLKVANASPGDQQK